MRPGLGGRSKPPRGRMTRGIITITIPIVVVIKNNNASHNNNNSNTNNNNNNNDNDNSNNTVLYLRGRLLNLGLGTCQCLQKHPLQERAPGASSWSFVAETLNVASRVPCWVFSKKALCQEAKFLGLGAVFFLQTPALAGKMAGTSWSRGARQHGA